MNREGKTKKIKKSFEIAQNNKNNRIVCVSFSIGHSHSEQFGIHVRTHTLAHIYKKKLVIVLLSILARKTLVVRSILSPTIQILTFATEIYLMNIGKFFTFYSFVRTCVCVCVNVRVL